MTKVFVIDDSPDVRNRLVDALKEIEHVRVMGEYESATQAMEGIKEHEPDVVILDDRLKQGGGLEVLRFIKSEYPTATVIVFSDYAEAYQREIFISAGADYFFGKADGCEALLDVTRELARDT